MPRVELGEGLGQSGEPLGQAVVAETDLGSGREQEAEGVARRGLHLCHLEPLAEFASFEGEQHLARTEPGGAVDADAALALLVEAYEERSCESVSGSPAADRIAAAVHEVEFTRRDNAGEFGLLDGDGDAPMERDIDRSALDPRQGLDARAHLFGAQG